MIHHVTIEVADVDRSSAFYDAVLGSLGWRRHTDSEQEIGWGINKPVFFISMRGDVQPQPGGERVCFTASGLAGVRVAWERGVATGGTDDGGPDRRAEYGRSYYSAYLLDPDGYRLEIAVGG